MKIRLLQWNTWFKEDVENKLQLLKEVNADIYCLQELNISKDNNEFEYIKEKLHLKGALGTTDTDHGGQGNAILAKFPINYSETSFVKEPVEPRTHFSDEGRIYVETQIQLPDNTMLNIGTTHMSYTDAFEENMLKEGESNKLLELIGDHKTNFIFSGDLNTPEDSKLIKELEKSLDNAGPNYEEKTWTTKDFNYNGFTAKSLEWRLDFIFKTMDIKVVNAKVVHTDFSDHLPILVELEI
ncbi:MAG: endonuclease/exonuclease/phosphatase family protein [Patescibacteria group bacterium]|jgi:endonuclease/exonuclease/phosphatase family metal-dependent hydrolase